MPSGFWFAVCLHLQFQQTPTVRAVFGSGTYGKPIVLHAKVYADSERRLIPDLEAFHGPDLAGDNPMGVFLQCQPNQWR